ncbi:retrovirus-related pol polyprotein from transposon TNT 1-94 [Tanacetum coccineum]
MLKGKAIVTSSAPTYDPEPATVTEDEEYDIDDESDDQDLEEHYTYMEQIQEVTPDLVDNSGPIFDDEPMHKVQNNNDNYNVFAMENEHPEQPESSNHIYLAEQGNTNITIDSLDVCYDRDQDDQDDTDDLDQERNLLASLIQKLKCEIDDSKNQNKFLESSNKALVDKLKGEIEDFKTKNKSLESSNNHFKEENNELSKTNQLMFKDLKKFQAELDKYNDVNYASKVEIDCAKAKGDLIFAKPEFLKKAQRANPRLYDIDCYNDNLALMLAFESDKTIHLDKESRSKLSDLIRPFDCDKLNNLYELFVPQREKSPEQHYFPRTVQKMFLNEIDRLSREYYYADHMNAILGVYTDLDEVTNLQCDYLETMEKLQRKDKNDKSFKENQSNVFLKEREQYFEIQDLKAQLQDKGIAISELKKLIEKMKGKSVKLSLKNLRFSKSKSVTTQNVSHDFSKPVTAQILPQNVLPIFKNTNVIAPGMYKVHTKANQTRTLQLPQDIWKTNKRVSFSTGVIPTTSVSRLQLKSNQLEDRVVSNNSQGKKKEVEDHRRNFMFSNNKTSVTACNDNLNAKTSNVNFVCVTCGKCVLDDNHDLCVLHYINGVNSRTRQPMAMPISTREPKHNKFWKRVKFGNDQIAPILGYGDLVQGTITIKRVYYVEGLNHNLFSVGQFCDADLEVAFRKSTCYIRDLKGNDLLTGSRGTDLYSISLQDSTTPNPICLMAKATSSQAWLWHRRLSHLNFDTINLLSKNNIVNGLPKLKFVKDHLCSSCELGKAKRKSFHTKTTPSSKRRLQLLHMDLCGPMRVESINGKKYVLVIVDDYSRYTWTHFLRSKDETPGVLIDFLTLVQRGLHAQGIRHETSTARTPEQNGIVERRNRTLVEAARTMLSAAKVPLFFWAKAIATACFTQNRSLVIPRHEKTPYHIINARKPSVKFFHIFGSLCYIVRDGENLDKIKEKGDACIFVGYSTQSKAYRVHNDQTQYYEQDSLSPGPQSQENVPQVAETVTTSNELELLYSPMFSELLNGTSHVVSKSSAVHAADNPDKRQHSNTQLTRSTTTICRSPPLNINNSNTIKLNSQDQLSLQSENIIQAETQYRNAQFDDDEFNQTHQ